MSPDPHSRRSRALIYNRVSSDPSDQRISTASQDRENRAYCDEQGWEVVATVTDNDRSASQFATRAREGYAQVLEALDGSVFGRVDILVTWEASRRERDLGVFVALRQRLEANGVLLAYKRRIYDMSRVDDRFATGLDALLAEREAHEIQQRILRSHRDSVTRGTPRGVVPYGYRREYDRATGRMIGQVPDPKTAGVVQGIVARILAGDTLYAIAADLNRRRVPTPRIHRRRQQGREVDELGIWSGTQIRHVLGKQSLMGVRSHHGLAVGEATWDPIVDPADWQRVQALLNDPERVTHRGVAPEYLLSGIATCGVCGAWLRPFTNRGRATYRCEGLTKTGPKGHVSRGREALDRFVERPLLRRIQRKDFLANFAPEDGDDGVATAKVELANLQARLAEFEESAGTPGGISAAAFARIEARLLPQIEEARARAVPRSVPGPLLELAAGDPVALWERWTGEPGGLQRKRQVVRALMRIRVDRSTLPRGSRAFDAASVVLSWRGSGSSGGPGERVGEGAADE